MKPKRPRIVVFYGGESPNHDLSKETGYWVCQYIPRSKYDVTPVEVMNNGNWKVPLGTLPRSGSVDRTMNMFEKAVRPLHPRKAIQRLMARPVDSLITVVRGHGGDDGAFHSIGEALRIPVVGSSHETCQNTSNKHTFARFVSDIASTPYSRRYRVSAPVEEIVGEAKSQFMPPIILKPTSQEGSYGIEYIENVDDLSSAIKRTQMSHNEFMLQERTPGTELSFTLAEDKRGSVHVLPVTVITPKKVPYYDHASKRRAGRTELATLRALDDMLFQIAAMKARDIYDELGCEGIASFDMITHDGAINILEVNTIPTATQLTPLIHQLKTAGLHPTTLLEHLIEQRIQ